MRVFFDRVSGQHGRGDNTRFPPSWSQGRTFGSPAWHRHARRSAEQREWVQQRLPPAGPRAASDSGCDRRPCAARRAADSGAAEEHVRRDKHARPTDHQPSSPTPSSPARGLSAAPARSLLSLLSLLPGAAIGASCSHSCHLVTPAATLAATRAQSLEAAPAICFV